MPRSFPRFVLLAGFVLSGTAVAADEDYFGDDADEFGSDAYETYPNEYQYGDYDDDTRREVSPSDPYVGDWYEPYDDVEGMQDYEHYDTAEDRYGAYYDDYSWRTDEAEDFDQWYEDADEDWDLF